MGDIKLLLDAITSSSAIVDRVGAGSSCWWMELFFTVKRVPLNIYLSIYIYTLKTQRRIHTQHTFGSLARFSVSGVRV